MRVRRRTIAVAAIAAVVVVVGSSVGAAWFLNRASTYASACAAVADVNETRGDATPVSTGDSVAVILGDSYAQGQWIDDPRGDTWSTLLGEQMGWEAHVDGAGGTGFAAAGPCGDQTFADRVDAVLDHNPSVVIVQGGANDIPGTIAAPFAKLLDALADTATVIVIGPVNAPGFDTADITAIDAELTAASDNAGRDYVSMVGADLDFGPDQRHMTEAGNAAYAELVAAALRR